MCMEVLLTAHTCSAWEGLKKGSDPQELELKMVLSHRVGPQKHSAPLEEQLLLLTAEPT